MNNDQNESSIFLVLFAILAYMFLKKFILSLFLMVWKWPVMAFLFPFLYVPADISNNFFFWVRADIPDISATFIYILSQDNTLIVDLLENNPSYAGFVSSVNSFVATLLSPFFIYVFYLYTYKIYKYRNNDYKQKHSIDTLIKHQADLWPQVKPMVNVHPEKIDDLDYGEWAMCLEPYNFAKKYNILIEEENKIGDIYLRLDEGNATDVFQKQLGRPWKGVEDLNKYERYIFAILASRTCRETEHSLKLVGKIAWSLTTETKYSKKQLKEFENTAEFLVEEAIQKYKNRENIQDIINQHFYVNTVFARLQDESRNDGVLATADYIWLKPRNRPLWYILNNVGRKSAWTEAAGTWHHYNYEKVIKRKLPSPMITGAISALDIAFRESSEFYIPLDGHNRDLD